MNDCRKNVCLSAPAKLNLGLRIVGRRGDGYHLLESVFWPITLSDSLTVSPAAQSVVQCAWSPESPRQQELPTIEGNILSKVLQHPVVGRLGSWQVELQKRIPIEAGLGGGSADAGALLRYLSREFPASKYELRNVAAEIGADVPFFVEPVPSWIEGTGERQSVLPPEVSQMNLHFLLVFPPFGCNTREIFARYRAQSAPFSPPLGNTSFDRKNFLEYLQQTRNDLEAAALDAYEPLRNILKNLRRIDAVAAGLTGSGSTCYAAFLSRDAAEQSAQDLRQLLRKSDCKSIVASTFRT